MCGGDQRVVSNFHPHHYSAVSDMDDEQKTEFRLAFVSLVNRRLFLFVFLLSLLASQRSTIAAPADEAQLLRKMCDAGLCDAAAAYVRQRMQVELDRDAVAWWVMREMECLAQAAGRSAGDNTALWQNCIAPAQAYQQQYVANNSVDDDARWPWIQWQAGRCKLLHAQSVLAKFLANPASDPLRDLGLNIVRDALQDVDHLLTDLKRRQSLSARQGVSSGPQAPAEQLRNLAADASLLQCELLLIRSQIYPNGSADRAAALAEVQGKAQDLLKRTGEDWPVRPGLLLAIFTAQLESGDLSAINRLEQLAAQTDPVSISAMAAATAARAAAMAGQFSRAATVQQRLRQLVQADSTWAPLELLVTIEVAIAELQQQISETDPTDRLNQLSHQAKQLGDRYGAYWQARAEALIVGGMSNSQLGDPKLAMQLLMAQVRQLVTANQFDQAVEILRQAINAQSATGNGSLALELASSAAALLRHQKLWADSAEILADTTLRFSQESSAAAAHVWVVRSRSEEIKANPDDQVLSGAYEESLLNQIRHWPDNPATQPTRQWLRDWLVASGRLDDYLRLLHDLLDQTNQAGVRGGLLDDYLMQLLQTPLPKLLQHLEQARQPRQTTGDRLTSLAVEAVQVAALTIAPGAALSQWDERKTCQQRWQTMNEWLKSADQSQCASSDLVAAAVAILSIRMQQPVTMIAGYDPNRLKPPIRSALATCLAELLDHAGPQDNGDTARRSQTLAAIGIKGGWLEFDHAAYSPVSQAAMARLEGWLGSAEAAGRIESLANEHPKLGAVQLIWSRSLAEQGQVQQAVSAAKRVAAFAQTGSPMQLAARCQLIQLQIQSGQQTQAQQAARLLKATQPNLSEFWSQRLEALMN